MRRLIPSFLCFLALAAAAPAQTSPCVADEHRQFDFWLGHWRVESAAGDTLGHNTITRTADGCGLLEQWVGGGGGTGTSLNHFDPADGQWHQLWVGGTGLILHLAGGLDDGAMVLEGTRQGKDGPVRDRIGWRLLDDGRVRQRWQVSSDDGATWRPVFEGFYRRVD